MQLIAQRMDRTRVPLTAARLVSYYYDIDFTAQQRAFLTAKRVELVYLIDTAGRAELTGINPDLPGAITDSLRQRTRLLPRFDYGGADPARETLYGVYFDFPDYDDTFGVRSAPTRVTDYRTEMLTFNRARAADFAFLERTNQRLGVAFGGHLALPLGGRSTHLATGGGMYVQVVYTTEGLHSFGLVTTFDGNRRTGEIPTGSSFTQNPAPPTLTIGLSYGRDLGPWVFRGEGGYSQMNLTEVINGDFAAAAGWSFGLAADRLIPLGSGTTDFVYGGPSVSVGNLSPGIALRYYHLDIPELSGLSLEVGVRYRLIGYGVANYRYRSGYPE
jgi:hypothetical protein